MSGSLIGALVSMLTLLATGLATGTRVYYLLFALLAAMMVLGLVSTLWTLWTVRIDMKGIRSRVMRGETLMTVFTVRHASLLPVASIRIVLSEPSAVASAQEISVFTPPFVRRVYRHMIACPHRGVYEAGVVRIAVRDLFGLFTFSRKPELPMVRMEVMPGERETHPMILKASDMGPEFLARASEDTASPSDIRAWQDGDSLKKVHWKLSMRRREVMVRTYEESARPDTLVVPDLASITALRDRKLTVEDCICECSLGAVRAQLKAGYPVRMPLTAARPGEISGQFPADSAAFADALMRVQFDSPFAYEKVLMQMLARMQRTGGAILVTSQLSVRTIDLVMRMQHSGVTTRLVWVCDDAREEELRMLERVKMDGVQVHRVDPWQSEPRKASFVMDEWDF